MMPPEETRLRLARKFWTETTQYLNSLRRDLPTLKDGKTSPNPDLISRMFLAAHTVKGNLGMMQLLDIDLFDLNEPASDLESLMLRLHNQEVAPDAAVVQSLEKYLNQIESQFAIRQEIP